MVQARRSVRINLADDEECYVDDANALSSELAKKVVQRAICVRMITGVDRTGANNEYMGQAGIVDGLIVTAMHNISFGTNHDGDLETTILVLMEHGVVLAVPFQTVGFSVALLLPYRLEPVRGI
jgi:hypothetical protein